MRAFQQFLISNDGDCIHRVRIIALKRFRDSCEPSKVELSLMGMIIIYFINHFAALFHAPEGIFVVLVNAEFLSYKRKVNESHDEY